MRVEVIDLKTGKSKFMPEKHAKVLVKLKLARWPELLAEQVMETEEPIVEVEKIEEQQPAQEQPTKQPEQQPAIIRRGRKPKFRG